MHDGGTPFLVKAGREDKDITSYKQWETAFKVFMGLFVQVWPDRATELLQYSHVIHTASLTYPWENVYNYDIAIRELMTEKPNRLWGVICQQTWALELGEPLNKVTYQGTPSVTEKQRDKPTRNVCWRYNKGRCTLRNCEYDHRCAHCGKPGHGKHECFKWSKGSKAREVKKEKADK